MKLSLSLSALGKISLFYRQNLPGEKQLDQNGDIYTHFAYIEYIYPPIYS